MSEEGRERGRKRKRQTHGGLEGGVEVSEEGVVTAESQKSLLHHSGLHVVVLQHHVFLEGLDSKVLLVPLQLGQQHLHVQHAIEKEIKMSYTGFNFNGYQRGNKAKANNSIPRRRMNVLVQLEYTMGPKTLSHVL